MKRRRSAVLASLLLLTGCSRNVPANSSVQESTSEVSPAAPLTVTFMKVGKADGMILQTEHHTVVIDCGEKSDGKKMAARLQEYGVTEVDYLILTHYDQDHIGGAAKVVQNFGVQHILAADYTEDSKEFRKLTEAMQEKGLSLEIPEETMTFTLDDAIFTVYPHIADEYQDGFDNNCSLVTKVEHHSQTMLFTGDAMQERLNEIMDLGDCDLLKVPYHGREIANLPAFLQAVTPEYAVISTDEETLSAVTMQELTTRGIETFVTFSDGSIIATSDGQTITIETQP